jgi:predicted metal-dependent enzyme (double-stranded beta helix superfamily)
MARKKMLSAAETFVHGLREAFAQGLDGDARWQRCRELSRELIRDPELQRHAEAWPVTGFDGKKVSNLLFYEDPDYGFVMNALIKNPGGSAMVHDHGPAWTIYGLVAGTERIVRFDACPRGDGKFDITESRSDDCGPGDVDIVAPREIHSEYADAEKSIAFIVRSQRSGTFTQHHYDPDSGEVTAYGGPRQIPFTLA